MLGDNADCSTSHVVPHVLRHMADIEAIHSNEGTETVRAPPVE
jgi:hypothetical protein